MLFKAFKAARFIILFIVWGDTFFFISNFFFESFIFTGFGLLEGFKPDNLFKSDMIYYDLFNFSILLAVRIFNPVYYDIFNLIDISYAFIVLTRGLYYF